MTILQESLQLSNGVEIPKVGHGTWQMSVAEAAASTKFALNHGYIHIDTAIVYENHEGVAQGIKESNLKREDLFLTTKVPASFKSYEEAKEAIDTALVELEVEYLDLMLIHAPRPWDEMREPKENRYFSENLEVWRALEEAYEAGKIKAIGVSNFDIDDLKNIIDHAKIKPQVNQIIYHAGHKNVNSELEAFCRQENILIEAYSPLATGGLLDNEQIKVISEKHNKTIPQIALRFIYQKELVLLPKSKTEAYILENADLDFELDEKDMAYLDSLSTQY